MHGRLHLGEVQVLCRVKGRARIVGRQHHQWLKTTVNAMQDHRRRQVNE